MKIKETIVYIRLRKLLYSLGVLDNKASKDYYISKVSKKAPWVYIAYISDVFYHIDNEHYISSHQNKKEAIAMVEVLNQLGYNVYVQDYLSGKNIPNINPRIIIGLEPNMVRASKKYPNAWKIYYATGACGDHQNKQIKYMTDYVNRKYDSQLPYRRLVDYNDSDYCMLRAYELADNILMIGSKYTIETIPLSFQSKITTIHQSIQLKITPQIKYSLNNEFFFMGSHGNILKGISLLLEFFSEHTEYILNIVGPIEDDFRNALDSKFTNNIICHGYIDVNSKSFLEITERCNFVIYPSGSEGMPGAVLNSMKCGLIPIVTKWAAFDEIEEYGYIMDNWDGESINKGITWALSLSKDEIIMLKNRCSKYVNQSYNLNIFKKELMKFHNEKAPTLSDKGAGACDKGGQRDSSATSTLTEGYKRI